MRFLRIGLIAALAFAAAGCGAAKPAGSVPAGAEFAPAGSALYLVVDTNTSSAQWQKAARLLDRFPGKNKFLADIRKELTKDKLSWERDVKPALGDQITVVFFDFKHNGDDVVGYTKPRDEAKFNKLVACCGNSAVHRKIGGWTVFADKQAIIDRFATAKGSGSLADEKQFKEAMGDLPKDAAVRAYVSGDQIESAITSAAQADPSAESFSKIMDAYGKLSYVSFSASAEDKGVSVKASSKSTPALKLSNYSAKLDGNLPSGALLYFSFGNLEVVFNKILDTVDKNVPSFEQQRKQVEDALGFSLKKDLFPLFSREGALAIYKGRPIPGIVFMLDVSGKEDNADTVFRRFGALAQTGGGAQTRTFKVDGVDAREIQFPAEGFSIFNAVHDGTLVVTNTEKLLRDSLGSGGKLADDPLYKQARDASGAPGDTVGFLYLNLEDGLPYVFGFAESAQPGSITPDVRANTKPLRSIFLYTKRNGDRYSSSGFLTIQ